jgi:O-antigen ligase
VRLERAQLGLVAAVAATSLVSIFVAQLALTLAILVWLARLLRGDTRFVAQPFDAPVLAFAVWTLLSAAFSRNPVASHDSAKKLVLCVLLYVAVDVLRSSTARERVLDAALLGGLALAGGVLTQYYLLGFDTLDNRPRSFLGHYMTTSGLLMCVLVLATARVLFRGDRRAPWARADLGRVGALVLALLVLAGLRSADLFGVEAERLFVAGLGVGAIGLAVSTGPWPTRSTGMLLAWVAVPLCAWALLVSRTRNAWLGTLAGLAVVAVLRAPRLLWLLAACVGGVLVLRPAPVMDRLTLMDASSRDRIYMWQAGIDMILDKPVFGQGPGMITTVYPEYRWQGAPNPQAAHLHDNALQIAAERGLPCLAWWLWWMAAAIGDAFREARRQRDGPGWCAVATLGVLTAIMVGGLFEYNFGDSEVLMFTLVVMALPYALRLEREQPA